MLYPLVLSDTVDVRQPAGQCDCDCDCTHPPPPIAAVQEQALAAGLLEPRILRTAATHQLRLDDQYILCYSPDHAPAVLNEPALELLEQFAQPGSTMSALEDVGSLWGETLLRETLANLIRAGLLIANTDAALSTAAEQSTLSAWLHVTDRCNLRCTYCYLPHIRADMSPEIGRAAIDAIFRSAAAHGYSTVKLKFAGGEALLCFPLIVELQQYAREVAARQECQLDAVVLSNATLLTPDIIETMRSLDMRLMISLDGLGRLHDQQRPYAGGRGSFEDVRRGIDIACSYGLMPDISITVTSGSAAGLAELVEWVLKRDLPFSLNFYRENERSATNSTLRLEEQTIIAGMRAAYAVIEANMPRRSLLSSLIDRANLAVAHTHTCGVGRHYLVFDYKGRVAKCQMHMPATVATAADGDPLSIIRADRLGIQNVPVDQKEGCRTCEWKHWCTGGCPVATFRATGRYDVRSPNCAIYKALYPEVMRLEGMRLLRAAGIRAGVRQSPQILQQSPGINIPLIMLEYS